MPISYSLKSGSIQAVPGRIMNSFTVKPRRVVAFFEDISANYVKLCERKGHKKELQGIAKRWGFIVTNNLMPYLIRNLPLKIYINLLAKKAWIEIGILDNISASKDGNTIYLETERESITRIVGENVFMTGLYEGVLSAICKSDVCAIEAVQSTDACRYVFEQTGKDIAIKSKDVEEYMRLNNFKKSPGIELKHAVSSSIFSLNNNKMYFRGKLLTLAENTIFHLLGNDKLCIGSVAGISYDYFSKIIKPSSMNSCLVLLKSLLQSMGWGIVNISVNRTEIEIYIKNPPYGLQTESENFKFLASTTLGYLKVTDKKYAISSCSSKPGLLKIVFNN